MRCVKVSMMIRITLKGNPGPLEEVMIMKLYLITKTICEKIHSLREESAGLLVRSQGVAMLTHLQRSCSLLQMFALIVRSAVHRVGGSRFARRACTTRTPRLSRSARRFGLVHPLSTSCTHRSWRCAQLLPSRGQENKKCVGVKNKGS
jgi:hypothetical protein